MRDSTKRSVPRICRWGCYLCVAVWFGVGCGHSTQGETFSLTTLLNADSVPPPTDPELFTLFEQSGFAGDEVLTVASGSLEELLGVFRAAPGQPTETIIDGTTNDPQTGNPIFGLIFPQGNGTDVVTSAASNDAGGNPSTGIYRFNGTPGDLSTIVARGATLPGESDVVRSVGISLYSLGPDDVSYRASVNFGLPTERTGIFVSPLSSATTTTLVDTNTAVPGLPSVQFTGFGFGRSAYDGTTAVFRGDFDAGRGVYTVSAGSTPTPILAEGDLLPGTALGTEYELQRSPVQDGDDLVFLAGNGGPQGIYAVFDDVLTRVVDTDTPLPQNPPATFTGFGIGAVAASSGYALDNQRVAFEGLGSDGSSGVYLYDAGEISLVLQVGDLIDGLEVALLDITEESLLGHRLVMDVVLADFVTETVDGRVILAAPILAGDYNDDGVVDALDYAVWRDNLGTPAGTLPNDADGGVIGQAQYATWKTNFGMMRPSTASAAQNSVPEPSALVLCLLLTAAITTARRQ